MADITMCDGKKCDLASTCYRYKAEPSKYRQSYFVDAPIENGECDYYWKVQEVYTDEGQLLYIKLLNKD
jgi:hypothetical protein